MKISLSLLGRERASDRASERVGWSDRLRESIRLQRAGRSAHRAHRRLAPIFRLFIVIHTIYNTLYDFMLILQLIFFTPGLA